MARRRSYTNWYAMREDLELGLRNSGQFPPNVRIDGRIRWLERGLNHRNYVFYLEGEAAETGALVYREIIQDHDDPNDDPVRRLEQEALTLQALATQELPFAVPHFVSFVDGSDGRPKGIIETAVPGIGLDELKKSEDQQQLVMDSIARVAAAVHRLDPAAYKHLDDAQEHRTTLLGELQAMESDPAADKLIRAAVAWAREHLSVDYSPCVVHGDLLPQNLLRDWATGQLGVIDWEYTRFADPAHDLAIVTRGHRHPFGKHGGTLRTFIDRYREHGGGPVDWTQVMSHEMILALRWWQQSLSDERNNVHESYSSAHYHQQVAGLLRRAEQGRDQG